VHKGPEAYICHIPIGDKCRILVDGDAAIDEDPRGGGDMGQLL